MKQPTFVAVDWSGAKTTSAQRKTIWSAVVQDGRITESRNGRTRAEVTEWLVALPGPLVVGLDFSFGLPEWFARQHGCATIEDVWSLAAQRGEEWLLPTAPFWRHRCDVPEQQRFRRAEARLREAGFPPKSVFQCVGNGQVGPGSIRGMATLVRLREAGFAIWPFDRPAARTVYEIYPTLARADAPELAREPFSSGDERDAIVSALVMWRHRNLFAALPAARDATTRLEGDVWEPAVRPARRGAARGR